MECLGGGIGMRTPQSIYGVGIDHGIPHKTTNEFVFKNSNIEVLSTSPFPTNCRGSFVIINMQLKLAEDQEYVDITP